MTDIDLIREFGEHLDEGSRAAPAVSTRHRLVSEMTADTRGARHRGAPLSGTRGTGRWRASLIGTATVAVVLAVGAVIISAIPSGRSDVRHAGPVLDAQPQERPPDPDGFVYTRTQVEERELILDRRLDPEEFASFDPADGETRVGDDVAEEDDYTEERWWPVDGSAGVLTFAEDHGTTLECGTDGALSETIKPDDACTIDPGYVTTLPTDADAMLAYLRRGVSPEGDPDPTTAFDALNKATELLVHRMVPSATKRVIFEALVSAPEHEIVRDLALPGGRTGTGVVATTDRGTSLERRMLVFDVDTSDLVSLRVRSYSDGDRPAVWSYDMTVVERAVMPDARVRPDGTRHTGSINSRTHVRFRDPR
jgi:hypothetical protein